MKLAGDNMDLENRGYSQEHDRMEITKREKGGGGGGKGMERQSDGHKENHVTH